MSEFAFLLRLQEVYHLTANEAILYFALLRETRKEAKTYVIAQLQCYCYGLHRTTIVRLLSSLTDKGLLACEQLLHGAYRISAIDTDDSDGSAEEPLRTSEEQNAHESAKCSGMSKMLGNEQNAHESAKCSGMSKMLGNEQNAHESAKCTGKYPLLDPVLEKEENEEKERSKEKEEKEERGGGGSKLKMESKIDLKTTTTTFSLKNNFNTWWCNYGMTEWQAQYDQCLDFWCHLSDDERRRIMDHTAAFATSNLKKPPNKRKEPYYYLCRDKLWRNDLSTVQAELKVYSGHEAEEAKRRGLELWSCRLPSGRYGLVSVADAERLGLEKKWRL